MITKDKINFYLEKKTKVHIETKDKRFYNGILLECSDEHIILVDRYAGEMFFPLSEITLIELYKEEGEWKSGGVVIVKNVDSLVMI